MTGHIIPLHGEAHKDAQLLLSWFVTGKLSPEERARVAAHLDTCPDCQADVQFERKLDRRPIPANLDADHAWKVMQQRLDAQLRGTAAPTWLSKLGSRLRKGWDGYGAWLGWAVALQATILLVFVMFGLDRHIDQHTDRPGEQQLRYHVLSSSTPTPVGNMVVIFRPEVRLGELKSLLAANHARLVDGPNGADAYLINVPGPQRAAALNRLRAAAAVVMAEPVDASDAR